MQTSPTRALSVTTLVGTAVLALACGNEGGSPTSQLPTTLDVTFVSSTPAGGGVLVVARTNNLPVSLAVTFSVSVPEGQGGSYSWNTAVQADFPPMSPVATTAFQTVPLVPGVQTVTITQFHSTNAYCLSGQAARASSTIDVDIRAATAPLTQGGAQVLGKKFNVSFGLECR